MDVFEKSCIELSSYQLHDLAIISQEATPKHDVGTRLFYIHTCIYLIYIYTMYR